MGSRSQLNGVAQIECYIWSAVDGKIRCDTCVPTFVKPLETTTYKLLVRDQSGCELSDELTVYVDKKRRVFIPTTFSPNGDGTNDRFVVFSDPTVRKVQTMQVFNRWGSLIFQQNDFLPNDESQGWDGTQRGVVLSPDVYVFLIKVEFVDGKIELYKGDVTIMK